MKLNTKWFAIISGTILVGTAMLIYRLGFPPYDSDATKLSAIVLIGLALTVLFMAILAIIYSVMGVENKDQALGLPEGSVRALLAFSLVLIFVCLAAFLFSEVNKNPAGAGKTLSRVTEAQLSDLKSNFMVASELAKGDDGKLLYEQTPDKDGKPVDDLKHPLYSVTYYPKSNSNATDLAKQIFTTLATVFVSVVSFYFGSSVTSSGVGAGAKAAQGPDTNGKTAPLHAALTKALADSHNAQAAFDKATEQLALANKDLAADPSSEQRKAAVQAAQQTLDNAKADLADKQKKVEAAQKALNDAEPQPKNPAPAS